jgi:dolichol-phosphate mannosyltransferase
MDTDRGIEISVVIPCHDEEENLEPLVSAIRKVLAPRCHDFEIVIVDDGSDDRSWEVLGRLVQEHRFLRALRFNRRRGQSAALAAGFGAARGETIVTMDGDLQNDPRVIPLLLDALDGYDCASGTRLSSRQEADGWFKARTSRLANRIRNAVTGIRFSDSACNFRALRRRCLSRLRFFDGAHRFLSTLLLLEGYRVVEVPIAARPRAHGRSKYGTLSRAFHAGADLLGVRWLAQRRVASDFDEEMAGEVREPVAARGRLTLR